jgi:hypothetical protein
MLQWAEPFWVKDQFPHKALSSKVENKKINDSKRNEIF